MSVLCACLCCFERRSNKYTEYKFTQGSDAPQDAHYSINPPFGHMDCGPFGHAASRTMDAQGPGNERGVDHAADGCKKREAT